MSLAADALRRARRTVGIDLVAGDLRHNQTIHLPLLANATALPFPARAFDTVISQWVIEHFDAPADALREMARVLRPGGRVIALTTNANNYVPLIGRLVPDSARNLAIRRLLRRPAHESHKTYYRANTARQLERLAAGVGLRVRRTAYVGNPFYFAFNVPLFRLALLFEHLTDPQPLRGLKLYLLADLERLP
jgi:SAM-dependent methyltransferase